MAHFQEFDPHISLAMSMVGQPGVYALLIGSGVSTGAQIPTGQGVIRALIEQSAVAAGDQVDESFDHANWWARYGDGSDLGYSSILERLGPTSAERQALLSTFFEATEDDRAEGAKVPGPAHHAIARLVVLGLVKVIITTNFDRLLETALELEGVSPVVVDSESSVAGMTPLAHSRCTVIKLNGDYTSLEQRNTEAELREYPPALDSLLRRVLDEYGLIACGWSGDWDTGLVEAIESQPSRRYSFYWSSYGTLSERAVRLANLRGAIVLPPETADDFFEGLQDRVGALQAMSDTPLNLATAVARLKRNLADPIKHIQVRDLIHDYLEKIESALARRMQAPAETEWSAIGVEFDRVAAQTSTLLHLVANGVLLDKDRLHIRLWIWTIERLMESGSHTSSSHWSTGLLKYPGHLVLRAAVMGALFSGDEDLVVELFMRPKAQAHPNSGIVSAYQFLRPSKVLDADAMNSIAAARNQPRSHFPSSRITYEVLKPVFLPLVGSETAYDRLFKRVEYRWAIAAHLPLRDSQTRPEAGDFMLEEDWTDSYEGADGSGELIWAQDFYAEGAPDAWGRQTDSSQRFDQTVQAVTTSLRRRRVD